MSGNSTVSIYHEPQESLLCGQHCLNNLLQGSYFTAVSLADIANELDAQENLLISDGSLATVQGSANVDDSGNFSIQVLRSALQRYNGIELVAWFSQLGEEDANPLEEKGFIINRSSHWFCIRKIRDNWWNLNSTNEKPQFISQFYLSAFLHELRTEGYSVFIAKGNIPAQGSPDLLEGFVPSSTGSWYYESELLTNKNSNGNDQINVSAFSGVGHRLGGNTCNDTVHQSDFLIGDNMGSDNDEDLELAKAISASLETSKALEPVTQYQGSNSKTETSSAATMRAKRLAALEKQGF